MLLRDLGWPVCNRRLTFTDVCHNDVGLYVLSTYGSSEMKWKDEYGESTEVVAVVKRLLKGLPKVSRTYHRFKGVSNICA